MRRHSLLPTTGTVTDVFDPGKPPVLVSTETRSCNIYVNFIIKFTGGLRLDPRDALESRRIGHGL